MRGVRLYPPGTRKGNRTYIARITLDGKRAEVNLHTANRALAEKRALEVVRGHRGPAVEDGRPRTFENVADHYLASKGSPPRAVSFLAKLKADEIGRRQIDQITSGDVAAAAHRLYPATSPATKNRAAIVPAAAVLHYAAEQGWCAWVKVKKFQEADPPTRRPDDGVPELLMQHATGPLKVLLTILFLQGWRLGEALDLTPKPERVNMTRRELLAWVGKVRRWKVVPMHDQVHAALTAYLPTLPKGARKLFPWVSRWGVYRRIRELLEDLEEKGHTVTFTPHMARHWFGSTLGDRQVPDRDIMDAGTWTSAKSVARYNKAREQRARETLSGLSFGAETGEIGKKPRKIKVG